MGLLPDVPPAKVHKRKRPRRAGVRGSHGKVPYETHTTPTLAAHSRGSFGHPAMISPATTGGLRRKPEYHPARTTDDITDMHECSLVSALVPAGNPCGRPTRDPSSTPPRRWS